MVLKTNQLIKIIGVGASAGGLSAFSKFLKNLPEDNEFSIIFVQHLSPEHDSLLEEILQKITSLKTIQVEAAPTKAFC